MELCVALDLPTKEENLDLIHKIKDYDVWLKVGLRTYIRDGEEFLLAIKKGVPKNYTLFANIGYLIDSNANQGVSYELSVIYTDS